MATITTTQTATDNTSRRNVVVNRQSSSLSSRPTGAVPTPSASNKSNETNTRNNNQNTVFPDPARLLREAERRRVASQAALPRVQQNNNTLTPPASLIPELTLMF